MPELHGRTILLTGASAGIGFETARVLGRAGANVIAHWARNHDGALNATADIPPDRKLLVQADFAEPASADDLWSAAVAWKGRVDVVICNAAVMPEAGVHDPDDVWSAAWEEALTVNVVQPAGLIRRAVQHFVDSGGGVLITMSSWAAQRGSGNPNLIAYASSKAALTTATKTVARAFATDGVLAYCVAPGAVRTGMTIRSAVNQGGEEAVVAELTMKELVPPTDVAELVAFLATGACRHLTGATLDVNGASYIR